VLREGRRAANGQLLINNILRDIEVPEFYRDVSELEGVELYQGKVMFDKPHYKKREQIMCVVEGFADFELVPHVNRQEVYAGQNIESSPYDDTSMSYESSEEAVSTSPVNFFAPKLGKFKHFKDAKKNTITLDTGDCIFLPAYYFYQFRAFKLGPGKNQDTILNKYFGKFDKENWAHGVGETKETMAQIVSL